MAKGDHLYVKRSLQYTHHGVDCGDGTVIHFSGEPGSKRAAAIVRESIDVFVNGGRLKVREYGWRDGAEIIIDRAESKLDSAGYNLLTGNCEHFVTWCCTGHATSGQVRVGASMTAQGAIATTTIAATPSLIAGVGAQAGLSGAGVMSSLAAAGGLIGQGAAFGPAVIGAPPAVAVCAMVRIALRDDPTLPDHERAARRDGRVASVVGAALASVGTVSAISAAGTAGLSAAGVTSGLAAIGAFVAGGGMVAGATVLTFASGGTAAVAAAGVFAVSRRLRRRRRLPVLAAVTDSPYPAGKGRETVGSDRVLAGIAEAVA